MGGTSTFKFDGLSYLKQCQSDEDKRTGMIAYNPDEVRVQYGMKLDKPTSSQEPCVLACCCAGVFM